ncbi:hypothetical protein [Methylobacterium brachythecii]|uniref:Uncharacterized protein n=1 Tax=Methylobacterium brachythecii TaxID=1176177 RepID=A0A7W6AP29_9HYPH|nr:hypothetical protein [Methylobacterium brachythecii]MBB3905364.1 hypothetical protein [Methylobacterium brachythecii]
MSAVRASRTRGDDIIRRYEAGERAKRDREAELAAWLDHHVEGRPGALERIWKRIPSTPSELGRGVKSPLVRTQIRGERFGGWGFERLCAALDACGYEAVVTVRPKAVA